MVVMKKDFREIRKAVFPVAGFGTRFLPATKAMPKELLPIVDKPLIQYAAEEAVKAGIETLIFVTGRNKRAIEDHFDSNSELEGALRAKGKKLQADMIHRILPRGVECVFVRQAEQLGLGHAILCAERVVNDEPFAVLLADDFICSGDSGVTSGLIKEYNRTGKTFLSVMDVELPEVTKYGVIVPGANGSVKGILEKPLPENAPSKTVSIGRYVLDNKIFSILKELTPGIDGEIQLADAINILAKSGEVGMKMLEGVRYDCGSVDGFVNAINFEYSRRLSKDG